MKKLLIIALLIVGCVFGDTIVYNNDILMFKRTKTLYKVEYVGIEEFKGKPVVKILKASGIFGSQYSFISCDKIIELKSYDGKPIDYDCSNLNNPINTPNPNNLTNNVQRSPSMLGGTLIAFGGAMLYSNFDKECDGCETSEDVEDFSKGINSTLKIGYGLIILGGISVALGI